MTKLIFPLNNVAIFRYNTISTFIKMKEKTEIFSICNTVHNVLNFHEKE